MSNSISTPSADQNLPLETYIHPDCREAGNAIVNARVADKMVAILGTCEVDYSGRADGNLLEGDCLVLVKQDGTLLVHTNKNMKPKNWQPPGADINIDVEEDTDTLVINSHRSRNDETLNVTFHTVYHLTVYEADEDVELVLEGTEDDMHEYIMENPSVIEAGFTPLENEKSVEFGSIDVYGEDQTGTPVIIEVKRRHAQLKHVDQLERYCSQFADDQEARGILVAPSASENAHESLEQRDLEFVSLDPDEVRGSE